jgi:outer membrane protein TolC
MSSRTTLVGLVLAALAQASGSAAQTTGADSMAVQEVQAEQEAPYQPPVITFDPAGLPLLEAARLTLQHDPNILLQDANTSFQEGIAQEQRGFFDYTLRGDVFYEYRQQELPQSRKDIEQDKRDQLDEGIERNEAAVREAATLARTLEEVLEEGPGSDAINDIPDPFLQAQIEIIDILIQDATSPEAAAELTAVRNDLLNESIATIQEGAEQLVAEFEAARLRRANLGDPPSDEVFYNGHLNLELAKLFRTGISLSPFFNSSLEGTNFKGKPRDVDFGGKGLEDLYNFRFGFNVVVPLMRGRGRDATGAGERAAEIDYEASLHSLQHETSVSVLSTALAYWDLRAAQETVAIIRRSVELQEQLIGLTQGRIDAGEIAQVELARGQASEARARARLESALQGLIQARVALATAMGIQGTEDEATLPTASDDFPPVPEEPILGEAEVVALAAEALNRRQDLLAAGLFEDSGMVLTRAAETDKRPLIDAVGSVFWTALDERSISNALDRWVGPSGSIQLDIQKPIANDLFEGRFLQRESDLRRRNITSTDLARVVQLGIVRTARSLEQAAERARQARRSVEGYDATVSAEFERFRTGDSTLIDAVLTEDQQLQAQQALISAQQEFAKLLAELRFESGRLVVHEPAGSVVEQQDLTTVPRPGTRR